MTAEFRYRALSTVVVRAPLLAAETFERLGASAAADPGGWWDDPELAFAVTVASPDLAAALDAASTPGAASEGVRAALQRYLIRAATRPTPFGGFAAVGVARWAERTDLEVAPGRRPTRTRADMGWLTDVAERLSRDPECRPSLRVYANTCAFERDGRVYLAEPGTGGTRAGPDVSVRSTPVVRRALALARPGIARDELSRRILAETPAGTAEKVDRLLDQLAEQQLLLPELLPTLVSEPLGHVRKALEGSTAPAAVEWSARLAAIGDACRAVDADDPATALREVRSLVDVQLDTRLPLAGTGITRTVADDASRAVETLFRLHPNPGARALSGYAAAFHRRYGDRRVPLLELLDPRFGLGQPSAHPPTQQHSHSTSQRDATLRALATAAIRDGGTEVVLDDALVERLAGGPLDADRLPPSVELSVFVAAADRAAVDRGDYLLVVGPNLGAQAAGRGLGRFADMIGPDAHDALVESAAAEPHDPSAIVAELVYRPLRARSGNVAVRPLVREYELPVGVPPTAPPHRVVHVDELSVGMRDGLFQVWWDTVDRPLVLTSGTMLNPGAAPGVCRALLELTSDGQVDFPMFDWGPMAQMPYLPRVRHGRVVLAPAQWRLSATDDLEEWRERWRVPSLVYLASADNRLLLDLDDSSHRAQLREALDGKRHALILQEALPGPGDGWLPGPRGGLAVELVVPVVRSGAGTRASRVAQSTVVFDDTDRLRPPGSDWLYVTLDGPGRTEDDVVAGPLGELADGIVARGDADGWFFVRYSDPDRQLRLRLHGDPATLTGRVLPELARWAAEAIAAGARTRLTLQTYERELERYGGPATTAICERLACVDSTAVRRLLALARSGQLDRVELGLLSAADLLASLAGPDSLADWAKALVGGGKGAGPGGARFREHKGRLRALLLARDGGSWAAVDESWAAVGERVAAVLDRRRAAVAPLAEALRTHWTDGTGHRSPRELASSILHLHANRVGLDSAAERVMLGLLDRTVRSLRAYRPAAGGTR